MKRILCITLLLILCLGIFCLTATAAAPTAALTGPEVVRAGDIVKLTFTMNGTGVYGMEGRLSYDASQLTLIGTTQEIADPWKVEFAGNRFMAFDDSQKTPINGETKIFTVTFQVNALEVGTAIKVAVTDLIPSDGENDMVMDGEIVYENTVAQPRSSDNLLKSLTVGNATITPAFDPNVTEYSASVPFAVSKLELSAEANHSGAKVSYNNPKLKEDAVTKVTVTVKAEDGSTKVYTLSITRPKDPNYVPSGNNHLESIQAEDFRLSPVFDPYQTDYLIWLPYETENVEITAKAADAGAQVTVQGGSNLVAGADNTITITCTAANGLERVYTIIAKRAAPHGSIPTEPTQPSTPSIPTDPSTTPESNPPQTSSSTPSGAPSGSTPLPTQPTQSSGNARVTMVVLYCLIGVLALAGFTVCIFVLIGSKKQGKYSK